MDHQHLLASITKQYSQILTDNLVGIYLHGSIAFGCFNWEGSDIDFIVVVDTPLPREIKLQLLQVLEDLRKQAPPKGFEMSVVLSKHCKNFVYPTPYELHFSNDFLEKYQEDPVLICDDKPKTDYDLAAHFKVIKSAGITTYGKPINETFGHIPRAAYIDSIYKDIKNAKNDVHQNPVYVILNLCRVYAHLKENQVLSKQAGGQWALKNLPQKHHPLITSMLNQYKTNKPHPNNQDQQKTFCQEILKLIEQKIKTLGLCPKPRSLF